MPRDRSSSAIRPHGMEVDMHVLQFSVQDEFFCIDPSALDRWFGLEVLNVMGIPMRIGAGVKKRRKALSQ